MSATLGEKQRSRLSARTTKIPIAHDAIWAQTLAAMSNIAAALSSLALVVCLLTGELAGQLSPNADADYLLLRNMSLQPQAITADKITLRRDAATFQLNSGTICFLGAVRGKVTGAVFVGEGKLLLDPPLPNEWASLSLLTKEKEYVESFDHVVLRFTDSTYEELKAAGKPGGGSCDTNLLYSSAKASRQELRYNLDARILQDVSEFRTRRIVRRFCPWQALRSQDPVVHRSSRCARRRA